MGIKIVEVKGGRGGRSAWNTEKLNKIIEKAKKSIEKNGVAIIERKKVAECYEGASQKWLSAKILRKLKEYFPNNQYSINFYSEVTYEDENGKQHKVSEAYIIKPKQ